MFHKIIVLGQLENAERVVQSLLGDLLKYGVITLVILTVLYVLYKMFLVGKKKPVYEEPTDLAIDVTKLGNDGPPQGGPVLEFCNLPVRLVAVVLAPAGRARQLPPPDQFGDVFDAILPGLSKVVTAQQPLVRCWPTNISTQGFSHTVFRQCRLPGDSGKGTPWSTLAGVFKVGGQPMMAGLVMRAAEPNSIGQEIVENEGQWRTRLQIKAS
jgi:hypothetical protein